ncbi:MAG: hypothetical protein ABI702_19660 [Burkholderiales bacterium]
MNDLSSRLVTKLARYSDKAQDLRYAGMLAEVVSELCTRHDPNCEHLPTYFAGEVAQGLAEAYERLYPPDDDE